jgi:hypothetical protein
MSLERVSSCWRGRAWDWEAYSDGDGTAFAALLRGQGVGKTQVGTPVTSSDGQNAQLGDDDGGADGCCDFLGGLDTESDVSLRVTNDHDGLESGTLTSTGLLLNGFDLQGETISIQALPNISTAYCHTFITSSFSLGRKKSTIWYSLIGRECR